MSQTTPPSTAVRRLPIWMTVAATYRSVLVEHLRLLPKAAFAPFLISLALQIAHTSLAGIADPQTGTPPQAGLAGLVFALLGFVPYVIFGVAWHRLVLLGPAAAPPSLMPGWRARHWRFYGFVLLITLALALLVVLFWAAIALVTGIGQSLEAEGATPEAIAPGAWWLLVLGVPAVILVVGWLAARLSFVFPAAAVDERYGLTNAWQQTRGQGLRIFAAFVLVSLPPLAASFLLIMVSGGSVYLVAPPQGEPGAAAVTLGSVTVFAMTVGMIVIGYISMALGVTVLSKAFQACSGWVPDE